MKKHYFKYLIDSLLFIDICSIAVVGLLLAVVPKGRETSSGFFLGLQHHAWADIHLVLSLVLLLLIALHLWLNWPWIIQCTQRFFGRFWKKVLWAISGAWVLVLLTAWLVS